jgi:hypothetical protein
MIAAILAIVMTTVRVRAAAMGKGSAGAEQYDRGRRD